LFYYSLELCIFCRKENQVMGVTSRAYPVGEGCYERLVDNGVPWGADTSIDEIKVGLLRARCGVHGVDASIQTKTINGKEYRYAVHRMDGKVLSCYLGVG
jgi:hypothetical protein